METESESPFIERAAQVLEAILFVSNAPVSPKEIKEYFALTEFSELIPKEVAFADVFPQMIQFLEERLNQNGGAITLREIAGGYQLFTRPEFGKFVRLAVVTKENKKLSKTALETLAIIAYRQPVPKSEVEFIRGVGCDYAIQKLLERRMVEPAGRAEDLPGKPLLYRTTPFFMEHFGLKSLEDLPKLKEFKTDEETVEEAFKTVR